MNAYRPARWWIPETLNRLGLPHFIFRQWRRDEVAALYRQAKRDGIRLSWQAWKDIEQRTPNRANRRDQIARLKHELERAKYRIAWLQDRLADEKDYAKQCNAAREASMLYVERVRATIRRHKGRSV